MWYLGRLGAGGKANNFQIYCVQAAREDVPEIKTVCKVFLNFERCYKQLNPEGTREVAQK